MFSNWKFILKVLKMYRGIVSIGSQYSKTQEAGMYKKPARQSMT